MADGQPKFDGVDFFRVGLFGVESRDEGFGGCSLHINSLAKSDEKSYKDTYSIVLQYDFVQHKYERYQGKYEQP